MIAGAFVLPWRNRVDVFRAAGVPLLALFGGALAYELAASHASQAWAWGLTAVNFVLGAWLAITVHRLVLLESPDNPLSFDSPAWKRLGKFCLAFIVVWAIYQLARILLVSIMLLPFSRYVPVGSAPLADPPVWVIDLIASALAALVLGRLSLVLPAVATDQPLKAGEIWRAGRKSSVRLAIVAGALPWACQYFGYLVYREGASRWNSRS